MENTIPIIDYKVDSIVITIPVDGLVFATENRVDGKYKVLDKVQFAKDFAFHLREYQSSNAVELGFSEFQMLIDQVVDQVVENCESIEYNDNF